MSYNGVAVRTLSNFHIVCVCATFAYNCYAHMEQKVAYDSRMCNVAAAAAAAAVTLKLITGSFLNDIHLCSARLRCA